MVSVTLFFCSPIVHRWNKQRILDFWSALQISEHFVTFYLIPGGLTVVYDVKSTILQLLLPSSVTINRNPLFWLTLCRLKLKKLIAKAESVKDEGWIFLPRFYVWWKMKNEIICQEFKGSHQRNIRTWGILTLQAACSTWLGLNPEQLKASSWHFCIAKVLNIPW